jgi:cystine transport system permease protein
VDWDLFRSSFWPILRGGLTGTIPLTLMSFVLGLALALVLALMRISGQPILSGSPARTSP